MTEAIKPKIYNPSRLDDKITVEDEEAFETARLLAVKEGLFVGMSSGAAVAGAIRLARGMNQGVIVKVHLLGSLSQIVDKVPGRVRNGIMLHDIADILLDISA